MTAFLSTPRTDVWECDINLINERLHADAGRLFVNNEDELEVWKHSGSGLVTLLVKGLGELNQHLQEEIKEQIIIYVIRQNNSWSRLRITEDTFKLLLSHFAVFPFFMGTVHAFGHRSKEDHYSWDNFHWRWLDRALNTFEVCYTLRFFEENHRGTGDPWSLRQTGIYQRVDYSKRTSRFILIQPSLYIEKRLRCKLHGMKQINSARHLDLFLIHITFLYATLVNWQNYITTQASELETLEEKSTFSKADYLDKNDYILRFADRQTLQSLRRHLLKAFRLLGCSIHVGEMLKKLCYEQVGCETGESKETLIHKLEDYIAEASYHRHIVTDLLQRSADTCELLTSLLQYRAGTSTLQGTNSLVQIAAQGEKDGKIAQRTSINAASLTFAATVYLPASLLAAIFSSNLVEVQNNHFLVAHEFWKFIVILIPMIIGTFALVAASQWYWMKWNNFRQRTTSLGNGKQSV